MNISMIYASCRRRTRSAPRPIPSLPRSRPRVHCRVRRHHIGHRIGIRPRFRSRSAHHRLTGQANKTARSPTFRARASWLSIHYCHVVESTTHHVLLFFFPREKGSFIPLILKRTNLKLNVIQLSRFILLEYVIFSTRLIINFLSDGGSNRVTIVSQELGNTLWRLKRPHCRLLRA